MKKILKYIDKPLLIVTVILFIVGLIMVFSASNVTAYMSYAASPYNYFFKQGLVLLGGLIAFFIIINFSTKSYGFFSWTLLIAFTASLVVLLIYGTAKNKAISWFDFGFFSLQPSEFIKVITIVFLATYYDRNQNKLDSWGKSLFPIGICLMIAGLIFLQADLGTTRVYGLIVIIIFLAVPITGEIKYKTIFAGVGLVVVAAIVIFSSGKGVLLERQLERFDYKRPCDKILSNGSQVCNCYIAINNGGLTGVGLGNSTQKYLYLPEAYTDFIFAIIVEELGVVTGVLLILSYIFVIFRILLIGRRCPNNRGAVICYGVAFYIFLHIAINLLGIMGLMPMTGVPLPFMSYGGSFSLCLIAALSLVQRVNIETNLLNEK